MPADSYSTRLRFRLQATGGNTNTWGALLNAAALQLAEDAICGVANITVSTGTYTLSTNNGAQDEARMAILNLGGAPTAAQNVVVPALPKLYLAINKTGQIMTVTTPSGTGVAVPVASNQWLCCDGTNVIAISAASLGTVANSNALGGLPASAYPTLAGPNDFTGANSVAFNNLTDGGTITLNAMLSNNFFVQLGGNRTLVINNIVDGEPLEIWFKQDGVGGRTITWPSNVKFEGNSTATLSTAPNAIDRFQLTYNVNQNIYIARSSIGFSTPGTININISGNQENVNVFALCGSPSGIVTVNLTTNNVDIQSLSPASPAMDFTGFTSGSTINWTNLGYVLGRGGNGGDGAEEGQSGGTLTSTNGGKNGNPGGDAVKGPGAGITWNITNGAGFIWGGGGGGGGGGATSGGSGGTVGNGGGGGGGNGGGSPGLGGTANTGTAASGANGLAGGAGRNGALGAGGAGNQSGGSSGAGGGGGDWATAGSSGSVSSGGGMPPGTGGAAGKAINLNGGAATFLSGSGGPNVKGAVS